MFRVEFYTLRCTVNLHSALSNAESLRSTLHSLPGRLSCTCSVRTLAKTVRVHVCLRRLFHERVSTLVNFGALRTVQCHCSCYVSVLLFGFTIQFGKQLRKIELAIVSFSELPFNAVVLIQDVYCTLFSSVQFNSVSCYLHASVFYIKQHAK